MPHFSQNAFPKDAFVIGNADVPLPSDSELLEAPWRMSEKIEDYLDDPATEEKIIMILNRHDIRTQESVDAATDLIGAVLVGLLHPNDLIKKLSAEVHLPQTNAQQLAIAISSGVFVPVRTELLEMYKAQPRPTAPPAPLHSIPPIPPPPPLSLQKPTTPPIPPPTPSPKPIAPLRESKPLPPPVTPRPPQPTSPPSFPPRPVTPPPSASTNNESITNKRIVDVPPFSAPKPPASTTPPPPTTLPVKPTEKPQTSVGSNVVDLKSNLPQNPRP